MTLACPICAVPDDVQLSAGVRSGAMVLIAVTILVLGPLAAYGVRLWRAERDDR